MKVVKFGGSSLANAEQIRKVCNIILSDPERRIAVVSAPGKRSKEDIKVTDLLIACAEAYLEKGNAEEEFQKVVTRYAEIAKELNIPNEVVFSISKDIKDRLESDTSNKKGFIDSLKAAGEDNCAKLVAGYLKSIGANAQYVNPKDAGLILSSEYGNAQVLPESYNNLKSLKDAEGIVIFPGFFGYSASGHVVTFSRGGSDITGSILAAAVDADLYENFTDVDCVFSVNPNIIPNPEPIHKLTYREMRELSYAGFSVFHEEAMVPVYHKGVPICIKNTNNPGSPGTTISTTRKNTGIPVIGIAGDTGFCSIYISKYLMNREVGFGRRILQIFEDEQLSYEHVPSGIDNMSVILKESQLDRTKEERIVQRILTELGVDDIVIQRGLALIMIVGEEIRNTPNVAYKAVDALSKAGINIDIISQSTSAVSIMFGISASQTTKAIKALYEAFFINK